MIKVGLSQIYSSAEDGPFVVHHDITVSPGRPPVKCSGNLEIRKDGQEASLARGLKTSLVEVAGLHCATCGLPITAIAQESVAAIV